MTQKSKLTTALNVTEVIGASWVKEPHLGADPSRHAFRKPLSLGLISGESRVYGGVILTRLTLWSCVCWPLVVRV